MEDKLDFVTIVIQYFGNEALSRRPNLRPKYSEEGLLNVLVQDSSQLISDIQ